MFVPIFGKLVPLHSPNKRATMIGRGHVLFRLPVPTKELVQPTQK
jgi:hypothetical protein